MNKKTSSPITAIQFLRKMRGGAQSCLLRASDGNFYIVKLLGNPQGSNVLFNEALGTQLMRKLGFSVPDWTPIEISDKFIDDNPEIWFETAQDGHQRPSAGIHFASKFLASRFAETLYEIVPRHWFAQIENRGAFVGVLLFDLWAGQSDNRQVVFTRNLEGRSFQAVFIDQGGLFGNTKDSRRNNLTRIRYTDPTIYIGLDIDSIIPVWESRIRSLDLQGICSSIYSMAADWQWYTSANFDQMIGRLREGSSSLVEYGCLIRQALNVSTDTLIHASNRRFDEVPIRSSQLCPDSYQRIDRSVSGVGRGSMC